MNTLERSDHGADALSEMWSLYVLPMRVWATLLGPAWGGVRMKASPVQSIA